MEYHYRLITIVRYKLHLGIKVCDLFYPYLVRRDNTEASYKRLYDTGWSYLYDPILCCYASYHVSRENDLRVNLHLQPLPLI